MTYEEMQELIDALETALEKCPRQSDNENVRSIKAHLIKAIAKLRLDNEDRYDSGLPVQALDLRCGGETEIQRRELVTTRNEGNEK